ncbi:MAG: hemerythrin domain-containing protein [Chloroflexi bacterium]|nr:hemerythrin domain-containing protein [Chloroflexota bacterium]
MPDARPRGVSNLKMEHENFRRKVGQVYSAIGGIDEMLTMAPEEKLGELRDRLFTIHDALVYLGESAASHIRKETKLLLERQTGKIARALKSQHDEIVQALEQSIKAIGEALPENASREQLREASVIIQNIFYGIIGMVMKHMASEDALIDIMVASGKKS